MQIKVTESAERHFRALLQKEDTQGMNIRIFAVDPGTSHAEIGLTFCLPGEEKSDDFVQNFGDFRLFIEAASSDALVDASIDLKQAGMDVELSIKAPYLKGIAPAVDSPLRERVQYVLDSEVNPNLAGHKGNVSLVDVLEGGIVVLQFGGGCQGCGMANMTLKQGIERTLKEKLPEITEVRDATDHALGENPYYAGTYSEGG